MGSLLSKRVTITLESIRARSNGCPMKFMLALCFTALCLTAPGQSAKPFFTRGDWLDYIATSKKIAKLETKIKYIYIATVERKGLIHLQGQAQKLSSEQVYQSDLDANKDWGSKTEPLQKEIARLKLKQQELDNLYAIPPAPPFTPNRPKK